MKDNPENGDGLGNAIQQTIEWVTRILAVCGIMGLILWGGMQIDARLGSKWFTPIGVVLGIAFGMSGLILVVKRMEIMSDSKKPTKPDDAP